MLLRYAIISLFVLNFSIYSADDYQSKAEKSLLQVVEKENVGLLPALLHEITKVRLDESIDTFGQRRGDILSQALLAAIKSGHIPMIRMIGMVWKNYSDDFGPIFAQAAVNGNLAIVGLIYEYGLQRAEAYHKEFLPLKSLIEHMEFFGEGEKNAITWLRRKADTSGTELLRGGLEAALKKGSLELVNFLWQQRAIHAPDWEKKIPCCEAQKMGCTDIADCIKGKKILHDDQLAQAVLYGSVEDVRILLEDKHIHPDGCGLYTPLYYAVTKKRLGKAKLLLAFGADVRRFYPALPRLNFQEGTVLDIVVQRRFEKNLGWRAIGFYNNIIRLLGEHNAPFSTDCNQKLIRLHPDIDKEQLKKDCFLNEMRRAQRRNQYYYHNNEFSTSRCNLTFPPFSFF